MLKRRRSSEEEGGRKGSGSGGNEAKRIATSSSPVATPTLNELSRLLDLTSLTSSNAILDRFSAIAETLLTQFHLCVSTPSGSTTVYEILELEFYLIKPGCHEDPFTHGSDEQRRSGHWYFHRAPTRSSQVHPNKTSSASASAAGGYRGGTRKGLDLTFGAAPDGIPLASTSTSTGPGALASRYFPPAESTSIAHDPPRPSTPPTPSAGQETRGGILLRTIRRLHDQKLISGPSVLVDEILRATGAHSIVHLVQDIWAGDTVALTLSDAAPGALRLIPVDVSSKGTQETGMDKNVEGKATVYSSPRIGLDLSHASIPLPSAGTDMSTTLAHPRIHFVAKPYRFFVHPHLLIANGRGHTFLGVYDRLRAMSAAGEQQVKDRLVQLTGLGMQTVERYLTAYSEGQAGEEGKPLLAAFVGSKGKGAGSSPATALGMFSAVRAATQ